MTHKTTSAQPAVGRALIGLLLALTLFLAGAGVASGQEPAPTDTEEPEGVVEEPGADEEPEIDPAVLEELREGSQIYSQICSSCHQSGGTGLPGRYPPLIGNERVDDADYVEEVIDNGKRGEIEVLGEIYNGVMPSFGTLNDEETAAVIAYIQNDFVLPPGAEDFGEPTGPVAGTELPALTNMGAVVAYLLAASVVGLVLAPRLLSQNDRLSMPWLDAWLKTAAITFGFVFATVVVPDWVLKTSAVAKLDRAAQDFIGVALWGGGFLTAMWALWYAHKDSRI